jgi:FixJ family two-component response regulator
MQTPPLIAVVDDEESVRKALCRLFISSGLECAPFASGREFLESLRQRVPDCVVLDLHMPGLTGLDVTRELSSGALKVPAIIITAHDEAGSQARCLSAGALAYLRKPFDDKALMNEVALALGGSQAVN